MRFVRLKGSEVIFLSVMINLVICKAYNALRFSFFIYITNLPYRRKCLLKNYIIELNQQLFALFFSCLRHFSPC